MGNDFFDNHPMLGSAFDFNRDGSLNLGEAGAMAAMGSMAATEFMRATEESEREGDCGPSYRKRQKRKNEERDYELDDEYAEYDEDRVYEIDTGDADEVMESVTCGDFDEADIEYLVREALCSGVKFDHDEAKEILDHIRERDLRNWVEDSLD